MKKLILRISGLTLLLFLLQQSYGMVPCAEVTRSYKDIFYFLEKNDIAGLKNLIRINSSCVYEINSLKATPLHVAVRKNDIELIKIFLESKANYVAIDVNHSTPLHLACKKRYKCKECWTIGGYHIWRCYGNASQVIQREIVKKLCERLHDGQIDLSDIKGNTPLHLAIKKENSHLVKELLSYNADLQAKNSKGYTPLHVAAETGNLQLCSLLIEKKCDVNEPVTVVNNEETILATPLHIACRQNDYNLALLFLSKDASVNSIDADGNTPLHVACRKENDLLWKELVSRSSSVDVPNKLGETALFIACKGGFESLCSILLDKNAASDHRNNHEETALHVATKNNHTDICRLLLNQSASNHVNEKDHEGRSALHNAVINENKEVCDWLISNDADVKTTDKKGLCLLHSAVDIQNASWCQILIEQNAEINSQDTEGVTPFMLACAKRSKEVRNVFLKHESLKLERADKCLKTCLFYACEAGRLPLCKKLVHHKSNVEHTMKGNSTLLHCACKSDNVPMIEWLLSILQNHNAQNNDKQTPLHVACEHGKFETVLALLEHGVDFDTVEKSGETPVHYAARSGYNTIIDLLIKYGSDLNKADNKGWTPLHCACFNGKDDAVKALLSLHALADILNDEGKTARTLAQNKGYQYIVSLFPSTDQKTDEKRPHESHQSGGGSFQSQVNEVPDSESDNASFISSAAPSSNPYDIHVPSESSTYKPLKHQRESLFDENQVSPRSFSSDQ